MYPERIVCMTEETTEALYRMGEERRIVGISGYTVRPPRARKEKPRVSAFTSANIEAILQLRPDLVLGFSDLQADIARDLIRAGVAVHIFNQRGVQGILSMLLQLGGLIGETAKAEVLVAELEANLEAARRAAAELPRRPKVYFEEWGDPMISAIGWVSELIGVAGGDDIFPELGRQAAGKDRIVTDPSEVVRRAPDVIIGSWCGRRFRPEKVAARPGWDAIPAIRNEELHEVKSSLILQPGPAALSDGVAALSQILRGWASRRDGSPG